MAAKNTVEIVFKGKDETKQAIQSVQGGLGQMEKSFTSLQQTVSGMANIIVSQYLERIGDALQNLARDVINTGQEYATQVENIARQTGATAEEASKLIQVGDDMRLEYGQLSTALRIFATKQAEATGVMKVSVDEIAALSDQYLKLAPGVQRTQFLIENFGRSGLAMGKLLEQGGDAILKMSAAVDESLIMTQEGINQSEEYRLAMDEWNDTIMGVKVELSQTLMPVLKDLVDILKTYVVPVLKTVIEWFTNLPGPAKGAVVGIGAIVVALSKIAPAIFGIIGIIKVMGIGAGGGGLLAGLGTAFASLGGIITGTLIPALAGIGATLAAVTAPVWLLIAAIGVLIATIITLGPEAANTASMIGQIVGAVMKRMAADIAAWSAQTIRTIGQTLANWWRSFSTWASNLGNSVKTWFQNVGRNIVTGIWTGIQAGWAWLVTSVQTLAQNLLKSVKAALGITSPSELFAKEIGAPIAQGIAQGFQQGMRSTSATIGRSMAGLPAASLAMAPAGGGGTRYSVGSLTINGSLSAGERKWIAGQQKAIATRTVEEIFR